MNIDDMIDPTKSPMLTASEREGINNVADMLLTPLPQYVPFRTIVLADETVIPVGLVLKAGLEALK